MVRAVRDPVDLDRVTPSESVCLSVNVWKTGAFLDFASLSGPSVRGAVHAFS